MIEGVSAQLLQRSAQTKRASSLPGAPRCCAHPPAPTSAPTKTRGSAPCLIPADPDPPKHSFLGAPSFLGIFVRTITFFFSLAPSVGRVLLTSAAPARRADGGHAATPQLRARRASLGCLFSHALCVRLFPCYVCYFTAIPLIHLFFPACTTLSVFCPPGSVGERWGPGTCSAPASAAATCLRQPPSHGAQEPDCFLRKSQRLWGQLPFLVLPRKLRPCLEGAGPRVKGDGVPTFPAPRCPCCRDAAVHGSSRSL